MTKTKVFQWILGAAILLFAGAGILFLMPKDSAPSFLRADVGTTPTCTITAAPTGVQSGGSSTLSWTTTNATSASIDQSIGSVAITSGTKSVSPTATTTYTLTVTGTGGTSTCMAQVAVFQCTGTTPTNASLFDQEESEGLTANIEKTYSATDTTVKCQYSCNSGYSWNGSACLASATAAAPTCTITAAPTSIQSGGSSTLSWTTTNATSASINQNIGSVAITSGTRSLSPTATTTYTMTVTGTGGTNTCAATVAIDTNTPSCTIIANPISVQSGGSSTLSWTTTNATSATIDQSIGSVAITSGTRSVSPSTTTTYTMRVIGTGGTASCTTQVTIQQVAAPTCTITANPTSIQSGSSSTISWTTTANATSATIDQNIGSVATLSGTRIVSPTATTTYTMTVAGSGGTSTCTTQVALSSYVCTSTIPLNATIFDAEESTALTVNTPWTYAVSDTSTKCQYTCNDGYLWSSPLCSRAFGIVVNNERKLWTFPVAVTGTKKSSRTYGGNSITMGTLTTASFPETVKENEILLIPSGGTGTYRWTFQENGVGTLVNANTRISCKVTACTGEVIFVSSTQKGNASVTITDSGGGSVSYAIEVIDSATESISIGTPKSTTNVGDKLQLTSQRKLFNGSILGQDTNDVKWEFSTDGGTTFFKNTSDASVSGGLFIPKKNGSYILRAFFEESYSTFGEGELKYTERKIISTNTIAVQVNPSILKIESIQTIGNAGIAPGTTETLKIRLTSENAINDLQNMEISMIKGSYSSPEEIPADAKKFVLEERQRSVEVTQKLADEGTKKTALFDIPVAIPVYNPSTDMTAGAYTFLVRVYSGDLELSAGTLKTFLGEGTLCDSNGDGILNVLDVVLAMKFFTNEVSPTSEQLSRVDLNQSRSVDLLDVIGIFQCILKPSPSVTPMPTATPRPTDPLSGLFSPTPTPNPTPTPSTTPTPTDPLSGLFSPTPTLAPTPSHTDPLSELFKTTPTP